MKFCLSPATLLKKRLWYRCFPVNFVKFLRTLFIYWTHLNDCFWILDTKVKVFHESISCFLKCPWNCISWNALKENFTVYPSLKNFCKKCYEFHYFVILVTYTHKLLFFSSIISTIPILHLAEAAIRGVLCKKVVFLEISQNLPENTCATLLKRDSGTGFFLWILWNF